MENLEVIARLKIRPDQLELFNSLAADVVSATRQRDHHTLRCDWFINDDGTECEVHELFRDEGGLIEHKMNTMEPTAALFRECVVDHHATLYGEVSADFVRLVTERMGAPSVFTFMHGLEPSATPNRDAIGQLEVIARLRIRPNCVEGFRRQVTEMLRLTQLKDTHTLRYDWFIDGDETECEVHELYANEQGMIEHNQHVVEARDQLFREFAYDHRMSVYGEISQQLRGLFDKHAGGVSTLSFVHGLEQASSV